MEVRAASRAARENMVRIAISLSIKNGNGDELSAYQIANKIGMRPQSPRFRDILSTMVRDGKLICREVQDCNLPRSGGRRFMYSLPKEAQPAKREVTVKRGGVPVGQLSLFDVAKN